MEHTNDKSLAFLLGSLLASYPDETFSHRLQALWQASTLDKACNTATPAWKDLRAGTAPLVENPEAPMQLRSDYIDLFDRAREANPLYETEYGRDRALAKGRELADIAGFYRAFGLELNREGAGRDMLDHIAIELEFYAILLLKQARLLALKDAEGSQIVSEARKSFLQDHLGRFVAAIAQRPGVRAHPFYSLLFRWISDLVAEECERLGVQPILTGWVANDAEPERMSCGGAIGCGPLPGHSSIRKPHNKECDRIS